MEPPEEPGTDLKTPGRRGPNFGEAGPGRPKGLQNRATVAAKKAIQEAFEEMGGVESLVKWAQEEKNKATFYAHIWPKILPHEISGPDGGPIEMKGIADLISYVHPVTA